MKNFTYCVLPFCQPVGRPYINHKTSLQSVDIDSLISEYVQKHKRNLMDA